MQLWPEIPFTFRIPWNENVPEYFENKSNVELIQCEYPILNTMNALLQGLDDEEWVYWCCDDRFPIEIKTEYINKVYRSLDDFRAYDFVKLSGAKCSWAKKMELVLPELTLEGDNKIKFLTQTRSHSWGFWWHHFCKVKILRTVFSSGKTIYDFQENIRGPKKCLQDTIGIAPSTDQIINLGEPCRRGELTGQGRHWLKKLNINHNVL